mmetsp:Transcript_24621/g.40538  ORF Transcript_24621/g.40538 Transcript_24621/m.40538 type:complete len:91 (-) Transcript_24621:74-346(-)
MLIQQGLLHTSRLHACEITCEMGTCLRSFAGALDILVVLHGPDSPRLKNVMLHLAQTHLRLKDFQRSLRLFQRLVDLSKSHYGPRSVQVT